MGTFCSHFSDLQVEAITKYVLHSLGLYTFFLPFLGKNIYEHVAKGVSTFLRKKGFYRNVKVDLLVHSM
ncbi:hypothetical protein L1887_05938 [Cichorium endivia]|nr:hypothetical protein L1887_05938 [Cichorium endivia]